MGGYAFVNKTSVTPHHGNMPKNNKHFSSKSPIHTETNSPSPCKSSKRVKRRTFSKPVTISVATQTLETIDAECQTVDIPHTNTACQQTSDLVSTPISSNGDALYSHQQCTETCTTPSESGYATDYDASGYCTDISSTGTITPDERNTKQNPNPSPLLPTLYSDPVYESQTLTSSQKTSSMNPKYINEISTNQKTNDPRNPMSCTTYTDNKKSKFFTIDAIYKLHTLSESIPPETLTKLLNTISN